MLPEINGRVAWIFEQANFDVDLIVGVENMTTQDVEVLKFVCMGDFDPDFANVVRQGDVIVGGENFGYGHPHFPACRALRAVGIGAIIAESFSPGFYRGESTNAFPVIECPGIVKAVDRWSTVSFDWDTEILTVVETGRQLKCAKIPQKTKDLIMAGGLIDYLRKTQRLKQVDSA